MQIFVVFFMLAPNDWLSDVAAFVKKIIKLKVAKTNR